MTPRLPAVQRVRDECVASVARTVNTELTMRNWAGRHSFSHHHGQLHNHVTWHRKHMMTAGDNLPVGLLLRTQKDHVLVEYATARMDNRLFVSKYQLELPRKDQLERFLESNRHPIDEEQGREP